MSSLLIPRPPVTFAHESEAEIANLLDFYGIHWEYEPRSFPLEWDAEGRAIQSFTPDFYLPDYDLFLEVTTVRPSLINRKNRKIRKLRENFPDVNIKLLTLKDVEALFMKYGVGRPGVETGQTQKILSEEASLTDLDAASAHASHATSAPTNLATHQDKKERTTP